MNDRSDRKTETAETPMSDMTMVERVARAIADEIGDGFDNAHRDKPAWIDARGDKAGRYRDVNEPYQVDYLAAARAAMVAMSTS